MHPAPHIRLVVHPARRAPGHTDWPGTTALPVPSLDSVVAAATEHRPSGVTWLSGGEPTLRHDLPQLITRLAELGHTVGLDSDGLALVQPRVVAALRAAGLSWLRLPMHSIIAGAHDWIEGTPGASKRIRRAAAAARSAEVQLAGTVLVTRSTVPHLVDTVRALSALGARTIHLRRPRRRGPAGEVFVTVSPRLGLAEPYLEAAVARGRDASTRIRLDGFPRCAAPRVRRDTLVDDADPYVVPEPLVDALRAVLAPLPAAPACPRCPGAPVCPGAPSDYVERFGRLELDDPGLSTSERPVPRPMVFGETPAPPPVRGGRSPATRLRFAIRQSATPDLGGDPTAGMDRNPLQPLHLRFGGPTRGLRMEMVRLAQSSSAPLDIDGGAALAGPDAHSLLREVVRLGFSEVRVTGDVTALGKRSKRSLTRLQGIHRFNGLLWHPDPEQHDALAGPGHHAAVLAALTKLRDIVGSEVGIAGQLPTQPGPGGIDAWTAAWGDGGLPGAPAFSFAAPPDRSAWEAVLSSSPPDLAPALRSALEAAQPTQ